MESSCATYMYEHTFLSYKLMFHLLYCTFTHIVQQPLKVLFNNVSTLKNLSCMSLYAISVFDKV